MKRCNKCKEHKNSSEFYADAGFATGISSICKVCKNKDTAEWRNANRSDYNASMRAYNAKHYEKLRLNRYGMTLEHHRQMLDKQCGVCAICKKPPGGERPLCVDHDHNTGKVRSLLCYGCNRLLVVMDSHPLQETVESYLKKHRED